MDIRKEETLIVEQMQEREYQTYLINLGKERNIIICLPTGSGKTFIAVQLAKYYIPTAIKEQKKIVFIANTVPLAKQQAEYFRSNLFNVFLNYNYVECLTGDRGVDMWKGMQWEKIMQKCYVIVMTPQILLDAITHKYVDLSDIVLLVLDECHNSDKDHPMNKIMGNYAEQREKGEKSLPRILGLTATIVNGKRNVNDICREIQEAETRLCAKAITYYNVELVSRFSTSAHENIRFEYFSTKQEAWYCDTDVLTGDLQNFLERIQCTPKELWNTNGAAKFLEINHHTLRSQQQVFAGKGSLKKDLSAMVKDIRGVYEDLGPYCARLAGIHKRACMQALIKQDHGNEMVLNFVRYLDTVLEKFITKIERYMTDVDPSLAIQKYITAKLQQLLESLLPYGQLTGENELCCIVFVEKRITAQVLCWFLQDLAECVKEKYAFLRPEFAVGLAAHNCDPAELRATSKVQTRVLNGFHKKLYNILVATKVIEEGLNVPSCNLVVRWDKVTNFPSYIQSMGRARARGSNFVAFINEANADKDRESYTQFRDYNNHLIQYLRRNAEDLENEELTAAPREEIEPYAPNGPGSYPRITAVEAVSIAYRYCQMLPCDKLVTLVPVSWWVDASETSTDIEAGKFFVVYVKFPTNSVIREIVKGDPYPTRSLAKRSAFLKACELLHKRNGLNDQLLPVRRDASGEIDFFLNDMKCFAESPNNDKFSEQNWYRKKVPECLEKMKILPLKCCKCYLISPLLVSDDPSNEVAQALYRFQERSYAYCILTPVDLGKIPDILLDVDTSIGSLSVRLREINLADRAQGVLLSEEELKRLQNFERYLFGDLLDLKRNFMVETQLRMSSMLFAPLKRNGLQEGISTEFALHWDLVNTCLQPGATQSPNPFEQSESFNFKPSDYDDALVSPWYLPGNRLFTVVKIISEMSPLSDFKYKPGFKNYKEYFEKSYYPAKITCIDQALLSCKQISKNLNFFTPDVAMKGKLERACIELVPELTWRHPMPASLLIQCKFLPSIHQRICRYLLADEVQPKLSKSNATWKESICPKNIELENRLKEGQRLTVFTEALSQKENDPPLNNSSSIQNGNMEDSKSKLLSDPQKLDEEVLPILIDYIHPKDIPFDRTAASELTGCENPDTFKHTVEFDLDTFEWCTRSCHELLPRKILNQIGLDARNITCDDQPTLYQLMEAITLKNSFDKVDLERFEVIGDSFLKYCVSRHLFLTYPDFDEGQLTQWRSNLVSNKYLYALGRELKLGEYLAAGIFRPDLAWLPSSFAIYDHFSETAALNDCNEDVFNNLEEEELEKLRQSRSFLEEFVQSRKKANEIRGKMPRNLSYKFARFKGKNVSDAVEALIGAYFMAAGVEGGLHAMREIGIRGPTTTKNERVPLGNWPQYEQKLYATSFDVRHYEQHGLFCEEIEKLLDYKFNNRWLLVEAFAHPCFTENISTNCYQRLEFLGDAVLDFLITYHVCCNNPSLTPGEVTDLRSALVNNVTFASLAVRYGLHAYLLHSSKSLQNGIDVFVESQKSVNHEVTGHFVLLSDFDSSSVNVQDIDVPKPLGDIFESLAGAVFVDSGMSLDTTWSVFHRLMKNEIDKFTDNPPKSPVRLLYEQYPGRNDLFLDVESGEDRRGGQYCVKLNVPMYVDGKEFYIVGHGNNKESAKVGASKYHNYLRRKNAQSV